MLNDLSRHILQVAYHLMHSILDMFPAGVLPEGVRGSIARSRGVRMLHTVLGVASPRGSSAAVWLEDRVYHSLCAVAIETSNQANQANQASSSGSKGENSRGGLTAAGGDTTLTTQGAGSAFNRYLANITRLTFALQVLTFASPWGHIAGCPYLLLDGCANTK